MTIEEKAKAYDKALEVAQKELKQDLHESGVWAIKRIFPQLCESEDERIRKKLIEIIGYFRSRGIDQQLCEKFLAYLKKQKEQPKEELVYRLNGLMQDYIKEGKDDEEKEHRFKCYQLFWDALEDASYFEQKEQKPAEWSEEDEDMLNSCISSIEEAKENRYAYKETDGDTSYDHEIAWLKSLRNRVGKEFLQPHWKPSEEQMKALLKAVDKARELHYSSNSGYDEYDIIRSLYKQLKELNDDNDR